MDNHLLEAVLESWSRQADIINRLAAKIEDRDLDSVAAPGEGSVAYHLCHIQEVRYFWFKKVSAARADTMPSLFVEPDYTTPTHDLSLIRKELARSAELMGEALREVLPEGKPVGINYTHPIHFLQHMVWHEGWHYGAMILALRQSGNEPNEEWQEENVWSIWRYEEPWIPPTE